MRNNLLFCLVGLAFFTCIRASSAAYNVTFSQSQPAIVGSSVVLTITATSSVPDLGRLYVSVNNKAATFAGGLPWVNCASAGCASLSAQVTLSSDYENTFVVDAFAETSAGAYAVEKALTLQFICGTEYCAPDPVMGEFTEWMRKHRYRECIVGHYNDKSMIALNVAPMKQFLDLSKTKKSTNVKVYFYDIVPTDANATYKSMGKGEGDPCQYNQNYPWICPSPVSADYAYLEKFFRKTFGLDINFVYVKVPVSYGATLGQPTLVNGAYRFGNFAARNQFINNVLRIGKNDIVHWAAETWNGAPIWDLTGGNEISVEPYNSLGILTSTHEWGHTWGLPHSFVSPSVNQYVSFALDGVMGNTYPVGSSEVAFDVLDPLERYALEPTDGTAYLDDAAFVEEYEKAILTSKIGTGSQPLLPNCGQPELSHYAAFIMSETPTTYTFSTAVLNSGTVSAGYVTVSLYLNKNPYETRVLRIIPAGSMSQPMNFTVPKALGDYTQWSFRVDPNNSISELDESNNSKAIAPPGTPHPW